MIIPKCWWNSVTVDGEVTDEKYAKVVAAIVEQINIKGVIGPIECKILTSDDGLTTEYTWRPVDE